MQKIQILFPDPVMDRLLEQTPEPMPKKRAAFPTFHGDGVLVDAARLKDLLHECNDGLLDKLSQEEILELMAYLMAGADKQHPVYAQ